ncbi:hypothetical protein ACJX0J_008454, partial [Zea mays]
KPQNLLYYYFIINSLPRLFVLLKLKNINENHLYNGITPQEFVNFYRMWGELKIRHIVIKYLFDFLKYQNMGGPTNHISHFLFHLGENNMQQNTRSANSLLGLKNRNPMAFRAFAQFAS